LGFFTDTAKQFLPNHSQQSDFRIENQILQLTEKMKLSVTQALAPPPVGE
jgi:hypothetical protein